MERVIIRLVRHGKGAEGMEIRRGMFGRRGWVDGKKTEESRENTSRAFRYFLNEPFLGGEPWCGEQLRNRRENEGRG